MKFRSWNENRNQFYYWQDGYYFKNKECTDDWNMISVWFNWQNAEQGFVISNVSIFINDDIEFFVKENGLKGYIRGRLVMVNNTPIVKTESKSYLLGKLNIIRFSVLGNIHEVEE